MLSNFKNLSARNKRAVITSLLWVVLSLTVIFLLRGEVITQNILLLDPPQ